MKKSGRENTARVGVPECSEIRQLAVTSEMAFMLEVTNWLPAG